MVDFKYKFIQDVNLEIGVYLYKMQLFPSNNDRFFHITKSFYCIYCITSDKGIFGHVNTSLLMVWKGKSSCIYWY